MDNKIAVAVYLPDAEAQKFLEFKRYYEIFEAMSAAGVFDIKYGKAILNFQAGILQTITKEEVAFKRYPPPQV